MSVVQSAVPAIRYCTEIEIPSYAGHGLTTESVAPIAALREEVRRYADQILALSPTALRFLKQSFNADSENIRGIGALGFQALALYYQTEESKEGAKAFREKRKPDFRSKRS